MCGYVGNLLVGGGGVKQCGKKGAGLNAGKHQYIGRIGYCISGLVPPQNNPPTVCRQFSKQVCWFFFYV